VTSKMTGFMTSENGDAVAGQPILRHRLRMMNHLVAARPAHAGPATQVSDV
jgi:hypothetical protein